MPFYTGTDGQLIIAPKAAEPNGDGVMPGEKAIAKVRSWSFTSTTVTHDVTSLGDTDRIYREGLRNGSGNASIIYHTNETGLGNVSELINLQMGERETGAPSGGISDDDPLKFKLKFVVGRGSGNAYYLIVFCGITTLQVTMSVGEICEANMAFEFNGAPQKFRL